MFRSPHEHLWCNSNINLIIMIANWHNTVYRLHLYQNVCYFSAHTFCVEVVNMLTGTFSMSVETKSKKKNKKNKQLNNREMNARGG